MKENAIEINDLCISYRGLKSYSIKKSLLHFRRNKVDEFQAIRHVSFNVRKGNILGIVPKYHIPNYKMAVENQRC